MGENSAIMLEKLVQNGITGMDPPQFKSPFGIFVVLLVSRLYIGYHGRSDYRKPKPSDKYLNRRSSRSAYKKIYPDIKLITKPIFNGN